MNLEKESVSGWRERYHKNYLIGIAISLGFHLLLLLCLLFFKPEMAESRLVYYDGTYIAHLTAVNVGKVDIGGGGSSGNGTEGAGKNFASIKTLAGIPVPASD